MISADACCELFVSSVGSRAGIEVFFISSVPIGKAVGSCRGTLCSGANSGKLNVGGGIVAGKGTVTAADPSAGVGE